MIFFCTLRWRLSRNFCLVKSNYRLNTDAIADYETEPYCVETVCQEPDDSLEGGRDVTTGIMIIFLLCYSI